MQIIGLIPARGGSKEVPRKNIVSCAGKPLISYTINAAQTSKRLARTFVSTDDPEIAEICRNAGADVPFLRPEGISGDTTPMIEVIRHFTGWLDSEKIGFDGIMLLQPTSPLRQENHIDEAVGVFEKMRPSSLVSVVEVPHNFSPGSIMEMRDSKLYESQNTQDYLRQNKPMYYARNGPAILIMSPQAIVAGHCYAEPCAAYIMDYWSSVDVDDQDTLMMADLFLRSRIKKI
jgi:CMP-N,N'-diacetyllegionaminic acid synthase